MRQRYWHLWTAEISSKASVHDELGLKHLSLDSSIFP